MKKLRYLILTILIMCCVGALAACGAPALSRPQLLRIDSDTLNLSWRAVKDARSYVISIQGAGIEGELNEERTSRKNTYALESLPEGEYSIKVKASGNGAVYSDSAWSSSIKFTREHEVGLSFALIKSKTEYEVTSMGTAEANVVVPEYYRGKPVTSIGERAFYGRKTNLESVVLSENITNIGSQAFMNCLNLKSVNIPSSVTSIGSGAFQSCRALESDIVIPEGITAIEDNTFAYCQSVTYVEIGENVKTIGNSAFFSCSQLENIVIPDSVETIGSDSFSLCGSVKQIVMGGGLKTIGTSAFAYDHGLREVNIGESVETVGESAFYGCENLETVNFSDSVKTIGLEAFRECAKLKNVSFGSNIEYIAQDAFTDTDKWKQEPNDFVVVNKWVVGVKNRELAQANFLSGAYKDVVGIASGAFMNCKKLTQVQLPESVKIIGENAFNGCSELTAVVIGGGTKTIGKYAFAKCVKLSTVHLGYYSWAQMQVTSSSLEFIDDYAFSGCTMLTANSIKFFPSLKTIGQKVFSGTALEAVATDVIYVDNWVVGSKAGIQASRLEIREGTVGIANYSFVYADSIVNAIIPDSVKYVGRGAFSGCGNLTTVKLPEGLTEIADYTFYKCSKLTLSSLPSTVKSIGRSAFYQCKSLGLAEAEPGQEITFTVPNGVVSIGAYAFYGCGSLNQISETEVELTGITKFIIGDGVQKIGDYAFTYFESLKSIIIGNSVTEIGTRAFYKCSYLENVVLGASLNKISERAFYMCTSLKEIIVPDGIAEIGEYAFYKCTGLESVKLGKGVKSISKYAFYGCSSLKNLSLNAGLEQIGKQAFRNCSNLESLTLGKDIKIIDNHAFYGCGKLTIYAGAEEKVKGWTAYWNSNRCPVIWGVETAQDENGYIYLVSFAKKNGSITNVNEKVTVFAPTRDGYTFGGWTTVNGGDTAEYTAENIATAPDGVTLYAIWTNS